MTAQKPSNNQDTVSPQNQAPDLRQEALAQEKARLASLHQEVSEDQLNPAIEQKESVAFVRDRITTILNTQGNESFSSHEKAQEHLMNLLEDIWNATNEAGLQFPAPTIEDLNIQEVPEGGFMQSLVEYLEKNNLFFMGAIHQVMKKETVTTTLGNIDQQYDLEWEGLLPPQLSWEDFSTGRTGEITKEPPVKVLIVGEEINTPNGINALGVTGGLYAYGKIIAFKQGVEKKFPNKTEKEIQNIINTIAIPNEAGHAYGRALGIDIGWQEPISDLFSMNQLHGEEMESFVISRIIAGDQIDQYGLSQVIFVEAIKITVPSLKGKKVINESESGGILITDELRKAIHQVSNNSESRDSFLTNFASLVKAFQKRYPDLSKQ